LSGHGHEAVLAEPVAHVKRHEAATLRSSEIR
jgi:hypothetical protein